LQIIKQFNSTSTVSFDVFENKYLVIYSGNSTVDVHEINRLISVDYKMRLPFYRDFEGYNFIYDGRESVVRTYREGFLALLVQKIDDRGYLKT